MKLGELKNKSILILGFGREGRDSFKFLRKMFPEKVLGIADRLEIKDHRPCLQGRGPAHMYMGCGLRFKIKDKKIKLHLGKDYLKAIENYDIIIKSPGIPIHLPEIEKAYKEGKITSQTEIFFENCPGKIIGIAGTKGKGTTATLIYRLLKEGKIRAHLIGNIGRPVLKFLSSAKPEDVYVYEVSSHQLYNLKKSPQIAVFLNIYPDHLDYFKNFQEYVSTETNITRYQRKNDYLVYNPRNEIVKKFARKSQAKKIVPTNYEFITNIRMINRFDSENIMAAVEVGKIFRIPEKKIAKVIKNFKPLPHRLEYIGTYQGIKFYDDSASTIPEATIFALDSLGDSVQTILLGGSEKKVGFKTLAKRILKSKIENIIFFPTSGEKIWQALRQAQGKKLPKPFFVNNMKSAVELAYQHTKKGKVCLLSPASASFGLFRSYQERGNLFKKYVKLYGKKA